MFEQSSELPGEDLGLRPIENAREIAEGIAIGGAKVSIRAHIRGQLRGVRLQIGIHVHQLEVRPGIVRVLGNGAIEIPYGFRRVFAEQRDANQKKCRSVVRRVVQFGAIAGREITRPIRDKRAGLLRILAGHVRRLAGADAGHAGE